jgi:Domain of unknown function (DUF362)
MLLDRACVDGGWNSGNSLVYGVPLRPHVEATAIALLALQDEQGAEMVQKSLSWLRQNAASVDSVSSLAWCILTLFVYQEPIGGLRNRLATIIGNGRDIRNNATLATAILALKCGEMIHPFEVLMKLDRRRFLGSSVGVAAAAGVTAEWVWPKHSVSYRRPRSAVAVLNAAEYSERIEALLLDGLRLFRLQVLGRSILLKPNLVEDLPGSVNTNSTLIGAAARCFLRLGAARVVIGEGPGHQRDTELVVQAAGLKPHLAERQIEFVDLNRDELRKVKLKANYSGLGELWLPSAVLESDFVVSMPKVKTHHWAGVTLSLKNMFGVGKHPMNPSGG